MSGSHRGRVTACSESAACLGLLVSAADPAVPGDFDRLQVGQVPLDAAVPREAAEIFLTIVVGFIAAAAAPMALLWLVQRGLCANRDARNLVAVERLTRVR